MTRCSSPPSLSIFLHLPSASPTLSVKSHPPVYMFFQVTSPVRRVLSGQSQSRNVSSLIFPVRRSASIETMTFSECFMSGYIVPRPLSPLCLRLPRCPHLCRDAHRTVCSITSSLSLPCVIHFSFSFFPDQYAGQQAVRQIVCCELHQTPRSIVSELC